MAKDADLLDQVYWHAFVESLNETMDPKYQTKYSAYNNVVASILRILDGYFKAMKSKYSPKKRKQDRSLGHLSQEYSPNAQRCQVRQES